MIHLGAALPRLYRSFFPEPLGVTFWVNADMFLKKQAQDEFWRGAMREGGLLYGNVSSWEKWEEILKEVRPQFAIAPSVFDEDICATDVKQLDKLSFLVEQPIIIPIRNPRLVKKIPEPYRIAIDLSAPGLVAPWGLGGREVWILGGGLRKQWWKYTELMTLGATVEGLVLPAKAWYSLATGGLSQPPDPYQNYISVEGKGEAAHRSLENYVSFWNAIDTAIPRPTGKI